MSDLDEGEFDYAAAYEGLLEFLYLTPAGIVKFAVDGMIDMANPAAAQLLMPLATDGDMSNLYRLLRSIVPDLQMHVKRYQPDAGQIFDQMQILIPASKITLMLDINKINATTFMAVVQDITDLTLARREVVQRTESQRLLASVFMRINTPALVVRADGFVLLSNKAFQTFMGYDSVGVAGLNVSALLPPDRNGAAQAAHSQQMLDGRSYSLLTTVELRDGHRVQVVINSSILVEAEVKQLRVITLTEGFGAGPPGMGSTRVRQVEVLDLGPIRNAIGADWARLSARGLALVEQELRRVLGLENVFKTGKGDSFIIWFIDTNQSRNAELLDQAAQAVRRVFMTEFGPKVRAYVEAVEKLDEQRAHRRRESDLVK